MTSRLRWSRERERERETDRDREIERETEREKYSKNGPPQSFCSIKSPCERERGSERERERAREREWTSSVSLLELFGWSFDHIAI